MTDEEILAIFEKAGMKFDVGARYSTYGQLGQLLKGASALIERCAIAAETQQRGTDYVWISGSCFEALTKQIARRIRTMATTPIEMDAKKLQAELRTAIANYMSSEGCGCCSDHDKHDEHEKVIAKLLNVEKYEDRSGYDFSSYESK